MRDPSDPVNLLTCSAEGVADVLGRAARLGAEDEYAGAPDRSTEALAHRLTSHYRVGHARAIRHAYRIGRMHARWQIEAAAEAPQKDE